MKGNLYRANRDFRLSSLRPVRAGDVHECVDRARSDPSTLILRNPLGTVFGAPESHFDREERP